MNRRGKVSTSPSRFRAAFASATICFYGGLRPEMIGPMIVGKLVGGVSAIAVARRG